MADSKLGKKVNDWTVLEEAGRNKSGTKLYLVRCECGDEFKRVLEQIKRSKCCMRCFRKRMIKNCTYIRKSTLKLCKNCAELNKL